jgi:hypothetical protein
MSYTLAFCDNAFDSNLETEYKTFEKIEEAVKASWNRRCFEIRNDQSYSSLNSMGGMNNTDNHLFYSPSTGLDPADDQLLQHFLLKTNFTIEYHGIKPVLFFVIQDYSRHGLFLFVQNCDQEVDSNCGVQFIGCENTCHEFIRMEQKIEENLIREYEEMRDS